MKAISALNSQLIQDKLKTSFPDIEFFLPDIGHQGVMLLERT